MHRQKNANKMEVQNNFIGNTVFGTIGGFESVSSEKLLGKKYEFRAGTGLVFGFYAFCFSQTIFFSHNLSSIICCCFYFLYHISSVNKSFIYENIYKKVSK